jgi:hypothetical protein
MIAYAVLLSIVALLGLLIRGRIAPAILFTVWAAGYHLVGLVGQREWLAAYTNSALVTLILLLLVSVALERSPLLDRFAGAVLKGGPARSILRLSVVTSLFSSILNNTAVVGAPRAAPYRPSVGVETGVSLSLPASLALTGGSGAVEPLGDVPVASAPCSRHLPTRLSLSRRPGSGNPAA